MLEKKCRTEEEDDPTYTPTEDRSTKNSGTPARKQVDDVDHISK